MVGTDMRPAIEAIAKLADEKNQARNAAEKVRYLPTPDRRKQILIDGDNRTTVEVPPADRHYKAFGLDSIVDMAGYGKNTDKRERQVVLVSPQAVTLVYDERDRSEFAAFQLQLSEAFVRVGALELDAKEDHNGDSWMTQREVLELLRVDLTGRVEPLDLIASLRQLKMTSGSTGESTIQTGKESIGKSVMAEISGVSRIPEDVHIFLEVYHNVHLGGKLIHDTVQCDLSTNMADQTFRVRPKAGELVRVQLSAMESIRAYLKNQLKSEELGEVPVFLAGM